MDGRVVAPTKAPCRIRAASLTWRWLTAGITTGNAAALTMRMIKMTTRSSTRVKPLLSFVLCPLSIFTIMILALRFHRWSGGCGW